MLKELFRLNFLQNNSLSGVSKSLTHRKISPPTVVVASVSSNGRPDRNVSVLMEDTLKEMRDNAPSSSSSQSQVIEKEPKDSNPTVGGGVEDVYGEDTATEDQYITPWTVSVAR